MKNIRDKNIGATIAYDANGNAAVVKMSSYDRIGRKDRQWVIYTMSGMPAIQLTYSYNAADELTQSSFDEWSNGKFVSKARRTRNYDFRGRLTEILDENSKRIASYEYSHNGNVKSKSYYGQGELVYKKLIHRDVQNRPTEIQYVNGLCNISRRIWHTQSL